VSNGAAGSPGPEQYDSVAASRVARLTPGQLDCLRLVNEHLSSKEIAAELHISPHTVDQRIRAALHILVRAALHILGVERRSQAARLVSRHAPSVPTAGDAAHQRLIHQSPYVEGDRISDQPMATVSHQIRHADRAGGAGAAGFITEQRPTTHRPSLQLPFATRSNPRNEMSVGQRLLWIVLIAIGAAFSAGMYLAGLESLSRLLNR
jgi:DNA-binding CsgD family transcriptional regulator